MSLTKSQVKKVNLILGEIRMSCTRYHHVLISVKHTAHRTIMSKTWPWKITCIITSNHWGLLLTESCSKWEQSYFTIQFISGIKAGLHIFVKLSCNHRFKCNFLILCSTPETRHNMPHSDMNSDINHLHTMPHMDPTICSSVEITVSSL